MEVKDFLLTAPDRLVLDVVGATLGQNAPRLYDGVKRGVVTDLRYSQFRPDVVRIVLDLDGPTTTRSSAPATPSGCLRPGEPSSRPGRPRKPTRKLVAEARRLAAAKRPEVGLPARPRRGAGRADEPRITVTWDRASIADVVAGFAAFSGRTIILGKDVKGEVTAEIKNQPWPMAFQAVLASQGLSAQEMSGGIIRVDAPSVLSALDSLEPLETSVVRVNYAQAGSLTKTVESILTKGRGRVVADTAPTP